MSKVIKGVHAFLGEHDISGVGTGLDASPEIEVQEYRPWNELAVRKEPGLATGSATLNGIFELDDAGKSLFDRRGVKVPFSAHLLRHPAQEGDDSLFLNPVQGSLQAPATQGDLSTFQLDLQADGPIIFGKVLAIGQKSASGNGGAIQFPAVAAGQTVYAVLHVTDVQGTGPTLDVVIESDDAAGFLSPTTRFTFAQLTVPGFEFLALPAAAGITDTWWRASWALGGTTPQATLSVSLGIV